MKKHKLMKAAIAGVMAYLEQEEIEQKKDKVNRWRHSGREMQMNNRHMVQTKIFKRK